MSRMGWVKGSWLRECGRNLGMRVGMFIYVFVRFLFFWSKVRLERKVGCVAVWGKIWGLFSCFGIKF